MMCTLSVTVHFIPFYNHILNIYKTFTAASAEMVAQVIGLRLSGEVNRRVSGYIEATLLYSNGTVAVGPVCGSVNALTGKFACYSYQRIMSTEQGTVASM